MPTYSNNVKNKLLVMYFINALNTPLLGYQIEDYFVENVLIETVELHTILDELTELAFVKTEVAFNRTYYTITAKGKEALESLESGLTETSRALINDYSAEKRDTIVNENNVLSSCKQSADGTFNLVLTLLDNAQPLMEMKLAIKDEDFAVAASRNWAKCSNDVYAAVVNLLLSGGGQ
ncbi:MAG: DUF4364 family protein [Clostridia bacterium]|nr:DUF4364 family protein [Clostridia bacterium]